MVFVDIGLVLSLSFVAIQWQCFAVPQANADGVSLACIVQNYFPRILHNLIKPKTSMAAFGGLAGSWGISLGLPRFDGQWA
jgi:hypothetical protein